MQVRIGHCFLSDLTTRRFLPEQCYTAPAKNFQEQRYDLSPKTGKCVSFLLYFSTGDDFL